jgi:hypothetical protein
MPKGEIEQAGSQGKQARKAVPTNEKKSKQPPAVAGEAQFRKGAGKAEGTKIKNTGGGKSGARPGAKRSSGAKPSGTNLSEGGGSAAKGSRKSASGARGKGARST